MIDKSYLKGFSLGEMLKKRKILSKKFKSQSKLGKINYFINQIPQGNG